MSDVFKPYDERAKKGLLRRVVSPCGRLVLYNYTDQCTFEKAWDEYTLAARGLIFELSTGNVVARPFPKFFNLGENESVSFANLPQEEFIAYEKMDGSLGIIYHYDNEWHVATRGSFTSDQAIRGKQILLEQIQEPYFHEDCTYLAEIIYPENKIIVNYGTETKLSLLGIINRDTGIEPLYMAVAAEGAGFHIPSRTEGKSLLQLMEEKKSLPKDEEGWVIRFSSGLRVKIKGDEYLKIAKILSECSPLAFWEVMENGKVPLSYLQQIPEEFLPEITPIVEKLETNYKSLAHEIGTAYFTECMGRNTSNRKEMALAFSKYVHKGALFSLLDGKESAVINYIMKQIRPTGNIL